ncbi:hypothetical protein THTE_3846 [Thermogutta terrifontis]|uniref:Uncharacterized protein n=1 Tax=Thermogutta terrifontis TaxID=1331910 RepID=A0A286RKG5_9BACT|nr:hypothetical protein THTE_3846 [Thermogutta terrifontis]
MLQLSRRCTRRAPQGTSALLLLDPEYPLTYRFGTIRKWGE